MELEEIIKLYGEVPLKFSSYYKYSFTYKGSADDGVEINASYGGCADDIYRHEVKADDVSKIGNDPTSEWSFLHVKKGDDVLFSESFSF